jgi:hypothetical protein
VSKKKTEVTNTKQIETRVKRQVVLEDGKVVEDSGPLVTTNTTEDTETQEHHQTELRKLGDDEADGPRALEGLVGKELAEPGSKWVSVANPDGVVREVKEKRVVSREETEEVKETEDVQHFGDITDEVRKCRRLIGQARCTIRPLCDRERVCMWRRVLLLCWSDGHRDSSLYPRGAERRRGLHDQSDNRSPPKT